MFNNGKLVCFMLALLATAWPETEAAAQWKPDRNVEFIIGTGPGGVFDRTARTIQQIWRETRMVTANTLVINKPGAGQSLAQAYLNEKTGDGHYLSIASGIIFSNHLTGKSPYAHTDFTPLGILFSEATVFAVNAGSTVVSAAGLMDRLRKEPTGPSFAVGSTLGSATHMAAAMVVKSAGGDVRRMKAVVLSSSGDSVIQVLGGHIDVVTSATTLVLPFAQTGKLRIIAVASPQRLKGLPEVPTWKEQGVDAVVTNWRGVIGPKGMNAEQISYWEHVFARTVASASWQVEIAKSFWEDIAMGSRDAKRFLDADFALNKAVLTELGLVK